MVVVYDITSERSFLNAREWMDSALEGAGREVTLMLLGNKMDLAQDDLMRYTDNRSGCKSYSYPFTGRSARRKA